MTKLLEDFLRENKERQIKASKLTDEQKEKAITFFKSHANLESKIDSKKWQKPETLLWSDINDVIETTKSSRSSIKKDVKEGKLDAIWKPYLDDVKIMYQDEDIICVAPLNHKVCVFMDSFQCYGHGATWCIGTADNPDYWKTYTKDKKSMFIFCYLPTDDKKWMIEYSLPNKFYTLWDQTDIDEITQASVEEVAKTLSIEPSFSNKLEQMFKDLIPYYKENLFRKPDPRYIPILGDNYDETPHGNIAAAFLESIIKDCDNYEANNGGTVDLLYHPETCQFTLSYSGDSFWFGPWGAHRMKDSLIDNVNVPRVFGIGSITKTLDEWARMDPMVMIDCPANLATLNIIKEIKAKQVIFFGIEDYEPYDSFPEKITGNFKLLLCDLDSMSLNSLTNNISGNIEVVQCHYPFYDFNIWQEHLTNNHNVFIGSKPLTPEQERDVYDFYYNESWSCDEQVHNEFDEHLKKYDNLFNPSDRIEAVVKDFVNEFSRDCFAPGSRLQKSDPAALRKKISNYVEFTVQGILKNKEIKRNRK